MTDSSAQPSLLLELRSQPILLSAARAMVAALAQRVGFNEIHCGQISLAVDEALCNIINHGYDRRDDGVIWLQVWVIEDGIRIVLEDEARQVEPESIKSRDLDDIRPGGLGVHLIREVMDEVKYEKRKTTGMRLTMVKRTDSIAGQPDTKAAMSSDTPRHSEAEHE
jgi:anti-sigma regulatory factor (Ser/Thr protein kinase)